MEEKVLIVDDDDSIRWVLQKAFEKKGYNVSTAKNGAEGLSLLEKGRYAVAFLDIMMPDLNGLELLEKAKEKKITTHFVIMTAQNTMQNAVDAMKHGAYDYITKPFDIDEVDLITKKILKDRAQSKESSGDNEEIIKKGEPGVNIIGQSPPMREVFKVIGKVSGSDVTVLIEGESGTGKELVAKAIHFNSGRASRPFVAINSAAIPKDLLESELFGHEKGSFSGAIEKRRGKFELAEGGTLFLDEIGDMSMDLQMKLLRALQEKEVDTVGGNVPVKVDVRVIAATNQDLLKAVRENRFREDLYYRLNVININLPPLKDRGADIELLAEYFLQKFSADLKAEKRYLSEQSIKFLREYSWPGNVRELENVIRRAVVLSTSSVILPEDLPSNVTHGRLYQGNNCEDMSLEEIIRLKLSPLVDAMDESNTEGFYALVLSQMERPLLKLTLEKCRWNQVKAARILGINRNTLKKKIDTLKIKKLHAAGR